MPSDAAPETKTELAARLARAAEAALGSDALPNPEGWRFAGVTLRACRGGDNRVEDDTHPIVRLELPERSISLAVMTRDDEKPAYRRSDKYDLSYFSDNSGESQQSTYDRDKETIDRFGDWVAQWEKAEG